jgi:glutamine synthetase
MLATFMAKPFNDEGGSGFHLHVSLVDEDGRNVFGDPARRVRPVRHRRAPRSPGSSRTRRR